MVEKSRRRRFASAVFGAHAAGRAAILLFLTTCQRSEPPETSSITRVGGTAALHEREHRYTIDPTCAALITRAATMHEEPALNRRAQDCAYVADLRIRQQAQEILREHARKHGEVMIGIPEFHDEQRLPIAGGKLGPKTGLYLSPFFSAFRDRSQLENHSSPGVLAAHVVVMQEDNEQFPPEYDALGLHWGVNCLYIETTAGGYKATMVKGTSTAPCRAHDGVVGGPATDLQVTVRPLSGSFTQDSMIAAARFQEDNEGGAVFGVPCLNEWCQISRAGKTPQPDSYCDWKLTDDDPVLQWTCDGKEMRVPSWYDEQMLDLKVGNDWVSAGVRAAIVPEPDIEKIPEGTFNTPQHVATIYLKSTPDQNTKYYRNGLRKGANKVELVKRPFGFQYIVTAPDGTSKNWRVLGPHKHYDAPIPGTARWRFTVRDIGIWGPCGQNCCDSDGFQ